MSDNKFPYVRSAFINAIREEGTKAEACNYLQEQWNETCALRAEITRLRAQVEAADKLAEAVTGLVSILDQNETKGPISDVQLMFCWLAAQDVRAAAKGAKAK